MEVNKMNENKKLYLAGISLEKDLEFCEILKEIENTKGVYILSKPEECTVIEMKYKNAFSSEREPTGKEHIGYEYHYITFLYKGLVFSLNPSSYYPFTDENDPGRWNFVVYLLTTPTTKQQTTYSIAYENFKSIDNYINNKNFKVLKGTNNQYITLGVTSNTETQIKNIVNKKGGYREKEIYNNGCFFEKGETWNSEHKVINVLNVYPDADGYRGGFAVDIVTGDICG
jgi:hypothetical protein